MAKYEALPTLPILANNTMLNTNELPELVHLEDPALSVMIDFTKTPPHTISPHQSLTHAIQEMEIDHVKFLLVMNNQGFFAGIISAEDTFGEKPIKLLQERRIHRDQITVQMIMTPLSLITSIDFAIAKSAKVGNIVNTLVSQQQHYALAVSANSEKNVQIIRGIFTSTQISRQLHRDVRL